MEYILPLLIGIAESYYFYRFMHNVPYLINVLIYVVLRLLGYAISGVQITPESTAIFLVILFILSCIMVKVFEIFQKNSFSFIPFFIACEGFSLLMSLLSTAMVSMVYVFT